MMKLGLYSVLFACTVWLYVNLFLLMCVTDDMLNLFCVCVSRLVKFFSGFSGKNLEFFCYRENEK